ncbi:MAG: hypothetical protein HC902_10090 [Calothrix sp. SM1_5_4]|nr:hypothetical protein [Calothrix sp. SM1_5_4]
MISYKNTPGEVSFSNAEIEGGQYSWTTISLEGIMRRTSDVVIANSPLVYGMRAGVQKHNTPFIFLDDNDEPRLRKNDMTTASLGLLGEWAKSKWTYYWLMRYQFPLSTEATGAAQFNISPVFAFDGSIGTSYSLSPQIKLGMFWYGQWHQ